MALRSLAVDARELRGDFALYLGGVAALVSL